MQTVYVRNRPIYQGWAVIGGKRYYYRSTWEVYYAIFLQQLKEERKIIEWLYEPDTFWFDKIKRGTRCYLPDFKVKHLDGSIEYVEVKGYMDKKSATKIKRMRIYHPDIKLRVVTKAWFDKKGIVLKSPQTGDNPYNA